MMRRYFSNKRGQTMVEFALVLPILLLLIFGIFQFGMMLYSLESVNAAAREGARVAAVGADDAAIAARARASVGNTGFFNPNNLVIAADRSSPGSIRVTVQLPNSQLMLLPFVSRFVPANLVGEVTMRDETL